MDWSHEENENLEWYGWIMEAIQIEQVQPEIQNFGQTFL